MLAATGSWLAACALRLLVYDVTASLTSGARRAAAADFESAANAEAAIPVELLALAEEVEGSPWEASPCRGPPGP